MKISCNNFQIGKIVEGNYKTLFIKDFFFFVFICDVDIFNLSSVLFLHAFPAVFVIFLWFGFSFLHIIPATDISYCSLFLFIMLLHISFHAYLFIQKDLGLCRPNNVDQIKRILGPICLYLPKPFYRRTVFCSRSVFCYRFVICCRSVFCYRSAADLYSFFGPFLLFGLLGGPLDLGFY